MGCRSALLAVRCDIAGPIAAKQRKNERKQSNGYSVSIYCVSVGSSGTLENSRALRLQECLQGQRPLVPMCRSVGEARDWGGGRDFAGDLFRRKKGCQGCGNSINARWEIDADLVGSVGSRGRCRDNRWTGVDDKICTRPEAVETYSNNPGLLSRTSTSPAAGLLEVACGWRTRCWRLLNQVSSFLTARLHVRANCFSDSMKRIWIVHAVGSVASNGVDETNRVDQVAVSIIRTTERIGAMSRQAIIWTRHRAEEHQIVAALRRTSQGQQEISKITPSRPIRLVSIRGEGGKG
ncbi:hypothetical protein B296_00030792 [Ensete ventricosum]|uniref:Uncharacterized protein n=1 Tax=Ensete ventricosum TaxID=4639 RepID=A0A426ZY40_ENSVE|nr:hypothetical protein B296_00030792 [Ensete ventricosum]